MAKLNSVMSQHLSEDDTNLEVDLVEMFGEDIPDSSAFRHEVGQAIIDKIRERADNNEFMNNAKQTYSDSYADSIEFKAYGKSQSDVNMKQTGDMLGLMDIVDESSDKIIIGWNDSTNNAKAYNHVTGDTVPRRNFLGLPVDDINSIAEDFRDQIPNREPDNLKLSDLNNQFLEKPTVTIEKVKTITGVRTFGQILKALSEEED